MIRVCDTIGELDRTGLFSLDGARSAESWVRAKLDVSLSHARTLVRRSRGFARFPQLREAASPSLSAKQ